MHLNTFRNAVQAAEKAFHYNERENFILAVERAQDAIEEHPDLTATLARTIPAFPTGCALELLLRVAADVWKRAPQRHNLTENLRG